MEAIASAPLVEGANIRVKRTRHGVMLYNVHDMFVGRSLELYGEFSISEVKLFSQIIKPGMTVLDIGANIGAHTLYFAEAVGPQGLVLAFEPQRILHQILCANLALNEIGNVRPLQVGVGREAGQAVVPAIDYANQGNFGGVSLNGHTDGEVVNVVSIDDINLDQCHLIKVDVEGMEQDVLVGASKTIAQHRPFLYVENDRSEKSPPLIDCILKMNYALYWHLPLLFSPNNFYGNSENVFPGILSHNMLGLPRELSTTMTGFHEITDPKDQPLFG